MFPKFFLTQKKLQSYRVTGLQTRKFSDGKSYKATDPKKFPTNFPTQKSYRVTELQGYRPEIFPNKFRRKNFSQKISDRKKVTELQGYRPEKISGGKKVTELQSYRATDTKFSNPKFFRQKKVTELQSYRATDPNFFSQKF